MTAVFRMIAIIIAAMLTITGVGTGGGKPGNSFFGENTDSYRTVTVDAANITGQMTHKATGFLYGFAEPDVPSENTLAAIGVYTAVAKPKAGLQHPMGDITQVYKTFFEIPVIFPTNGYTSTLIPIMLINFFASKFERSLKNHLPAVTQQFMVPFITILIAGAVGVLAIGPISMLIQNGLQAMLQWLIGVSSILAFAVITLIYQPLVIFGLHWPLITLGLMEFAAGSTLIVASIFPASFTHMAACLAVFLRTKSTKMKNIALPAFLSACESLDAISLFCNKVKYTTAVL